MSTLFDTNAFDYIDVLDKAADASWKRNELIANNIANVDTPNYKRQDINFEDALAQALKWTHMSDLDSQVDKVNMRRLSPRPYIDSAGYSYRVDGNNVDIDTENAELASNQIKYEGLTNSITSEFKNLQMVMKS